MGSECTHNVRRDSVDNNFAVRNDFLLLESLSSTSRSTSTSSSATNLNPIGKSNSYGISYSIRILAEQICEHGTDIALSNGIFDVTFTGGQDHSNNILCDFATPRRRVSATDLASVPTSTLLQHISSPNSSSSKNCNNMHGRLLEIFQQHQFEDNDQNFLFHGFKTLQQ